MFVLEFLTKKEIEKIFDKDSKLVIDYLLKKVLFSQPELLPGEKNGNIQMTKEFLENWVAQALNWKIIGAGNYPIDVYSEKDKIGADVKFLSAKTDKNGNFDFEKFKQELSQSEINFSKESYGMDWLGKSYARLLASDEATTLLKEDENWNKQEENQNSQNLLIKGDNLDKTTVDMDRFSMQLAGNPFQAELHVQTPMSDPGIRGSIKGKLNLGDFSDVIPLDDTKIKGSLNTALAFNGHLSSIEREQYNDFQASGTLTLRDFEYNSPDLTTPLTIQNLDMQFSPQFLELTDMKGTMGESDFQLSGRLENYLMYALKDENLRGSFYLTSSLLNLNELIPETEEAEDSTLTDTTRSEERRVGKECRSRWSPYH